MQWGKYQPSNSEKPKLKLRNGQEKNWRTKDMKIKLKAVLTWGDRGYTVRCNTESYTWSWTGKATLVGKIHTCRSRTRLQTCSWSQCGGQAGWSQTDTPCIAPWPPHMCPHSHTHITHSPTNKKNLKGYQTNHKQYFLKKSNKQKFPNNILAKDVAVSRQNTGLAWAQSSGFPPRDHSKPDVVAHACGPTTLEVGARIRSARSALTT